MKRTTHRTAALAALALTATFGLAACGSDDSSSSAGSDTSMSSDAMSSETASSDTMSSSPSESAMGNGAGADAFGPGCSAIPTDGAGSFDGMASQPVATAASANPLLKTLVAAVTKAGLVDTLNSADGITVFAPTDDAFAKIPPKTLKSVLKDKAALTAILTHHVVAGELGPDQLAGRHQTLNKDDVVVRGSGEDFTVKTAGGPAHVICGNIPTANATVYVVDTVLMPPM